MCDPFKSTKRAGANISGNEFIVFLFLHELLSAHAQTFSLKLKKKLILTKNRSRHVVSNFHVIVVVVAALFEIRSLPSLTTRVAFIMIIIINISLKISRSVAFLNQILNRNAATMLIINYY